MGGENVMRGRDQRVFSTSGDNNNVGNLARQRGSQPPADTVLPSHPGYVATSPWGTDRTQRFASTKPRRKTVPRQGMLGSRGLEDLIGLAEQPLTPNPAFVAPTGRLPDATKPTRQRFSRSGRRQATSGGSESPLESDP